MGFDNVFRSGSNIILSHKAAKHDYILNIFKSFI